jgi:hypothetical protein
MTQNAESYFDLGDLPPPTDEPREFKDLTLASVEGEIVVLSDLTKEERDAFGADGLTWSVLKVSSTRKARGRVQVAFTVENLKTGEIRTIRRSHYLQ